MCSAERRTFSIRRLSMRSADSSTPSRKVLFFICDYERHCSPPTFYSQSKELLCSLHFEVLFGESKLPFEGQPRRPSLDRSHRMNGEVTVMIPGSGLLRGGFLKRNVPRCVIHKR